MKRILLATLAILLTACLSPSGGAAPQTAEPTPTATALPTAIPTPTMDPVTLAVQDTFKEAGINPANIDNISNASWVSGGMEITIGNESVFLTEAELRNRAVIGADGNLQIMDSSKSYVEYAYDSVTNEVVNYSGYINKDKLDITKYPRVKSFEDLPEHYRVRRLFIPKFPPNVHLWEPGSVPINYSGYDPLYPFGKPGPGEVSGIEMFSYFLVEANPAEGRPYDMIMASVVIPNADGTAALIDVVSPEGDYNEDNLTRAGGTLALAVIDQNTVEGRFLMPLYNIEPELRMIGHASYRSYLRTIGIDSKNEVPEFKSQIEEWLTTGVFPSDADYYVYPSMAKYGVQK